MAIWSRSRPAVGPSVLWLDSAPESSEMYTVVEGYEMTPEGLKKVGSGTLEFVRGQDARHYCAGRCRDCDRQSARTHRGWRDEDLWRGERSNTLEGRAKATADAIAEELKIRFRARGWIK